MNTWNVLLPCTPAVSGPVMTIQEFLWAGSFLGRVRMARTSLKGTRRISLAFWVSSACRRFRGTT